MQTMKKLVSVNPITLRPTGLPLNPEVNPILSGQYQNAVEDEKMQIVDEDDFMRFIEEADEAQEKLDEAKADWIEPNECPKCGLEDHPHQTCAEADVTNTE